MKKFRHYTLLRGLPVNAKANVMNAIIPRLLLWILASEIITIVGSLHSIHNQWRQLIWAFGAQAHQYF